MEENNFNYQEEVLESRPFGWVCICFYCFNHIYNKFRDLARVVVWVTYLVCYYWIGYISGYKLQDKHWGLHVL